MKRKIFTLFFALVASAGTFATEIGSCGSGLIWSLNNGTLTIQGNGDMYDYANRGPWYSYQSSITKVVIQNGCTHIGNNAFNSCRKIPSVTIPSSVVSIGTGAFDGCTSLTDVTIPNSVTSIGASAFNGCNSLSSVNINSGAIISGSWLKEIFGTQVTEYILGNAITRIGNRAFYGCTSLTSISIPNGVISIGYSAFSGCTSLSQINIPNTVKEMGTSVFYECTSLPVIDNIRYADTYLVEALDKTLTSYSIRNGTRWIGESAFDGCRNLTKIDLPNSVTSLGTRAYAGCTSLTSISVPDNVTIIGERVFSGCANVKTAFLGTNVDTVGWYVLENCTQLDSVWFPQKTKVIPTAALSGCSNLTFAHCGDSLKTLSGLGGLKKLKKIVIPPTLTYIREKALANCTSIDSIVVPVNVDSIDKSAFAGCTGLRYIRWEARRINNKYYVDLNNPFIIPIQTTPEARRDIRDTIRTIEFGEQVEMIPDYLCYQMSNLDSIHIPQSVRSIGEKSFYQMKKLRKITVEEGNEYYDSRYDCNAIIEKDSSKLILGCGTTIIPQDITIIGASAFYDNRLLTTIHIPSNVEEIREMAFRGCRKLRNLSIDEGVNKIGYLAFANLDSLYEITIPRGITELGGQIFDTCPNLRDITYHNHIIGYNMFNRCSGLKKIVIPDNVTEMREAAFNQCDNLEEIIIGKGLVNIPKKAFWRCKHLEHLIIGSNVENIGAFAFYDCDSLTVLEIPDKVNYIDCQAFLSKSVKNVYMRPYNPPAGTCISGAFGTRQYNKQSNLFVPCGRIDAYAETEWNAYNLQYDSILHTLVVLTNDVLAGHVELTNEVCNNSIKAIPNEGYVFTHWSDGNTDNPRVITLTQDTSFTAIFAVQTFTIAFVDDNDTILASQIVEYNTMPIPPANPIKTNDAQYSYTFAGWSPTIVAATSDATYKATYNRTTNQYTIIFSNDDNSVLSSRLWDYGTIPTCEQPTKEEDDEYTYTFNGWSPEVVPVVADATYTATYEATPKSEGMEDVFGDTTEKPSKVFENGNIYILMPNGQKYSIIGNQIK